ncbi:putative quinol monooxygenase [Micromonospora sp. CPCC 205739]|uniref:putative quinol monooxygenase n=1 Tax=Micromonospora sp. CPCC 205739 TaxID=3122404 RepID=UPI003FA5E973
MQLVGPTREERGNVSYDAHQLMNNPAASYVLSNWGDEQALDAQLTSAHVRHCLGRLSRVRFVAPLAADRAMSCHPASDILSCQPTMSGVGWASPGGVDTLRAQSAHAAAGARGHRPLHPSRHRTRQGRSAFRRSRSACGPPERSRA